MVALLHTVLRSCTLPPEQTQFAIFRTALEPQIVPSAISSMLNAQTSPVMSPETKELTVPPTSGLAPTLRLDDLKLPSTVEHCVASMQPLVQFESQLLALLSDIDATPSPVASPTTQQSVAASPLTERAIRYRRRDAFRTDKNNAAPVSSPSSTAPSHTFGAEIHEMDRSYSTPAPLRRLFHFTIPNPIPSLNREQYRSPSFDNLRRMHPEFNTPATFPRATRAPYMTEQRSLSAGLRSLPHALSSLASSRAFPSAMSSSSTTSSASGAKPAATGPRPPTSVTAHARQAAPLGLPQGTSSPVASSTLREISGSGTDRTRGLRPDSPVPSRMSMGGPHGPPAPPTHLSYLTEVWNAMKPALRARLGLVTLQDAETSSEPARRRLGRVQTVSQTMPAPSLWPRRSTPTFYSLYKRERPPSPASTPISRAASNTTSRSSAQPPRTWPLPNAIISAPHPHSDQAPNRHPPPAPRRAQRPPSPSPLPLTQRVLPPLQLPWRLGVLCPRRHHRPPACRSPPQPSGQLLLRAAPGSLHHPPAMTDI